MRGNAETSEQIMRAEVSYLWELEEEAVFEQEEMS